MGQLGQRGWQYMPYQGTQNPYQGVPEEYWQDRLAGLGAMLPWAQLNQNGQQSAAERAWAQQQAGQQQDNWLKQFGAQQGQQGWDNQFQEKSLAATLQQRAAEMQLQRDQMAQSQGTQAADNWYRQAQMDLQRQAQQFSQGQAGQQQDNWLKQFGAQQGQQGWENQFAQGQAGQQQDNWLKQFGAQQAQADRSAQQWGQQFGEGQRQFNQQFGLDTQQLERLKAADAWNQAFQGGQFDWQKGQDLWGRAQADKNLEAQKYMTAMGSFRRAFGPYQG
jgi:hypothetical protein